MMAVSTSEPVDLSMILAESEARKRDLLLIMVSCDTPEENVPLITDEGDGRDVEIRSKIVAKSLACA
jgi:hypothetical protein